MALLNRKQDHRMAVVQAVVRSPGSCLDPDVRALMEAHFGRDFGRVRLHTDDQAAASARAVTAEAYTVGSHIVFDAGRYRSGTRDGLWLLAHELSHVIQQGGKCSIPRAVADPNDLLECVADQAADLIAAGSRLPPDFAFGAALDGVIQRHLGPLCGGYEVRVIDPPVILQAQAVIEGAYRQLVSPSPGSNLVSYGSANLPVPDGMSENRYRFATELLNAVRAWPAEERPNIVDFYERQAYFFNRRFSAGPAIIAAINRFHVLEQGIARRYNQEAWNSAAADWFPDHVLEFPGDLQQRFVCTQQTDHIPPRGLILYDIRRSQRLRRRARQIVIEDFEQKLAELGPMVRSGLPKLIRFFDADSPDYVIIVPQEVYSFDYFKLKAGQGWNQLRPKLPFLMEFKRQTVRAFAEPLKDPMFWFIIFAGPIGLIMLPGAIAAFLPATATVEATAVTTTTAAKTGAGTIEVVIAYETGGAAVVNTVVGTGAVTTQASAGTVVAYQAALAAPAVKTAATIAANSILLVVGNVKNADAATQSSARKPLIDVASAIRALPIDDFEPMSGVPSAFSTEPWKKHREAGEPAERDFAVGGKFGLGRMVFYDNRPHFILGRFSVQ